MRHRCFTTALIAIGLLSSAEADADETGSAKLGLKGLSPEERAALLQKLSAPRGIGAHMLAAVGMGDGVRFNNPYRLARQLGTTAESLSVTAPYVMLTAAATFGKADGLQHGGFASLSVALLGVSQAVLTPGYMMLYRGSSRWLAYARVGPAFVLSPQTNVGGEVALGGAAFLTGTFGVTLDLAGNIFYGASTWEKKYPTYPVISATLGFVVDFEVLP